MKEMSEQGRHAYEAALARRGRIAMRVFRVIGLMGGSFCMLLFVTALRTGYLTWIGITVGALFCGSLVISPLFGWAGRRRLELVCNGVHIGIIALLILSWAKASFWSGNAGAWRPYRFEDELAAIAARRAVPDAENAARRYDSLFAGMDEKDEPNFVLNGVSIRDKVEGRGWKSDDYPQISRWLDSQSEIADELLEIGKMEKCRWPIQADTYDEYTVPYERLRHCALLLTVAGNRDLGEGRTSQALEKYFCILRMADHLHQQPSMVDASTAFGRERSVLGMVRHVLVQSNLSPEAVADIAARLPPPADLWPQEWDGLLEFERLRYMNLLGRLYEVNDKGEVRFAANPMVSSRDPDGGQEGKNVAGIPRLYWLMSMPRDPHGVHRMVDKYFATFDRNVRSGPLPQIDWDQRSSRISWSDLGTACNLYRWFWETAFFNERTYLEHRWWRAPAIVTRRGTWLVLGLRRYHDVHGAWPQTLDLVAEYVPAEAFLDPMTGEAFVYTLDGDSFKLYSRGENRIDDGGRRGYVKALHKSEDDLSMWPPPPPPEPPDEESLRKELEDIYGKDWVEATFKNKGSDKK